MIDLFPDFEGDADADTTWKMATASEKIPDGSDVDQKYCYANCTREDKDSIKMIACDSPTCASEWYHIECVGLTPETVPPASKSWRCPSCAMTDEEQGELLLDDMGRTIGETDQDVRVKTAVTHTEADDDKFALPKPLGNMSDKAKGKKTKPRSSASEKKTESSIRSELANVQQEQDELELQLARLKLEKTRAQLASMKISAAVDSHGQDTKPKQQGFPTEESSAAKDLKAFIERFYKEDTEESDGKKKKKSGLYKKASDEVKVPQKWPHLNLGLEYSGRNIGFNDLSLAQFVAGESEIIVQCDDEVEKEARILFLKSLMYDAVSCKFANILNYYAAWVREIELGKHKWGDDFSKVGDNILKRAGLPDREEHKVEASSASSKKRAHKKVVWYCSMYNRGKCSKDDPHKQMINNKIREVKHICGACYNSSKEEANHPENSSMCPLYDSDSEK